MITHKGQDEREDRQERNDRPQRPIVVAPIPASAVLEPVADSSAAPQIQTIVETVREIPVETSAVLVEAPCEPQDEVAPIVVEAPVEVGDKEAIV